MPFTCEKCGISFTKQQGLRVHSARKRPCDAPSMHRCAHCPKQYTRADNLARHVAVCRNVLIAQYDILRTRVDAIEQKQNENVLNGSQKQGNVVNNYGNMAHTINNVNIEVRPWGGELALTDADIDTVLAKIPALAPTLPEVVSALMEIIKRAHTPITERNVHLSAKRSDQALVLIQGIESSGWAALPLVDATSALFDKASAKIASPAVATARPAHPTARQTHVSSLRASVPVQYRIDKETAVQLGLRPMEAHLANTRPGGPGPLLIEAAAPATMPVAAAAPAPTPPLERIKAAVLAHPLQCSESGAMLVGWIVNVSQAAKVDGRDLFLALESGDPAFAAARAAAQIFTAEKMRPRELLSP